MRWLDRVEIGCSKVEIGWRRVEIGRSRVEMVGWVEFDWCMVRTAPQYPVAGKVEPQ